MRKGITVLLLALLTLLMAPPAFAAPGKPNFGPAVYADGQLWGTKFTTVLPPPNGNEHAFDALFMFTNGVEGQMAVAEAAPGNPDYNGGRWISYTATWVAGEPALLTSYAEVMAAVAAGDLVVSLGAPGDGPDYFQCPLLPVK